MWSSGLGDSSCLGPATSRGRLFFPLFISLTLILILILKSFERVLSLDPIVFSKQLLYHSSNNKQRTIVQKERLKSVKDLFGQLVTVAHRAQVK